MSRHFAEMHHNVTIGRDTARPLHGACSALHATYVHAERTDQTTRQSHEPNKLRLLSCLASKFASSTHRACKTPASTNIDHSKASERKPDTVPVSSRSGRKTLKLPDRDPVCENHCVLKRQHRAILSTLLHIDSCCLNYGRCITRRSEIPGLHLAPFPHRYNSQT
jgi:hypothetical protein